MYQQFSYLVFLSPNMIFYSYHKPEYTKISIPSNRIINLRHYIYYKILMVSIRDPAKRKLYIREAAFYCFVRLNSWATSNHGRPTPAAACEELTKGRC